MTPVCSMAALHPAARWLVRALIPLAQFAAALSPSMLLATPPEPAPVITSSMRSESPVAVEPMLAVANDDSLDDDVRVRGIEQMADPENADQFLAHPNGRLRAAAVRRTARREALIQAAFDDPDPNVREAATSRLDDQDLLVNIARREQNRAVRFQAVKRIEGDDRLADLVMNNSNRELRALVTPLISSPARLIEIARRYDDDSRRIALSRITDRLLIAQLAESGDDAGLRLAATFQLDDQAALGRLARSAPHQAQRAAAIGRCNDAALIAELVDSEPDDELRAAAVLRLSDPARLEAAVRHDKAANVRRAAVERLTNKSLLIEVATHDADLSVRARAASRLDDQRALGQIATTDRSPEVRRAAAARLSDPATQRKVLLSDRDGSVRAAALERLPAEPEFVQQLALNDPSAEVRFLAAARLDSPALLARICRRDRNVHVQRAALARLNDQAALGRIVRSHPNWLIRREAASRLSDLDLLFAVAASDRDPDVRRAALDRLDQDRLETLARSAREAIVRTEATGQLLRAGPLAQLATDAVDLETRETAQARLEQLMEGEISSPSGPWRRIVSAPELIRALGRLRLTVRSWTEERRYARPVNTGTEAKKRKGVEFQQSIAVTVIQDDRVLFEETFRGRKPKKEESFESGLVNRAGYSVRYNDAQVDGLELASALLSSLPDGSLDALARSNDKYIKTAALLRRDEWRGPQPTRAMADEDRDDD